MPNIKKRATLKCNNCEKQFTDTLWTDIELGKNRVIDHKFFNDKINYYECSKCGNTGPALYPINIKDIKSEELSIFIPTHVPVEFDEPIADFFAVTKVLGRQSLRVFYSIDDLSVHKVNSLWGLQTPFFSPPPEEKNIQDALQKRILNDKEAKILREADWDTIMDVIQHQNVKGKRTLRNHEDKALELHLRFMRELSFSKKVVSIKN
jgi:hypothetical protein